MAGARTMPAPMSRRRCCAQIDRSRRNLGAECIDIYYLYNPETQLGEVPRAEFLRRLRLAFQELERACDARRIASYGTATWNGYRAGPDDEEHLSLGEILAAAHDVAGSRHRFRAIQLPFNIEMDEAATLRNQVGVTLLEAARAASLMARQLPQSVREVLRGVDTDAQRALQFARSTPGITCALVGMKTPAHVDENAALARVEPLSLRRAT